MSGSLKKIISIVKASLFNPYFGFVFGHSHLDNEEWQKVREYVGIKDDALVLKFESHFAALVGDGCAVSYAAARMGFFHLMKTLGIGKGDEVILLGATCSVMVNAVLRVGAKPIFSDLDQDTFGSSVVSIARCITTNTRMIVAQHSFGIPCDIEAVSDLAKSEGIFLLEDCALTLGSKINGSTVGNFGDAALFSTDHSKPLNTLTGGLVYSLNKNLIDQLRIEQEKFEDLSIKRQKALWRRLKLEAKYCVPSRYGRIKLIDALANIAKRLNLLSKDFLDDDFSLSTESDYPYPAKFPAFLAVLGLFEINRWPLVSKFRVSLAKNLLNLMRDRGFEVCLPSCYGDPRVEIVPLRIAWWQSDGGKVRDAMANFLDTDATWFMKPIIATKDNLSSFGYQVGSCKISEKIGPLMVNIPCNIMIDSKYLLTEKLRENLVYI